VADSRERPLGDLDGLRVRVVQVEPVENLAALGRSIDDFEFQLEERAVLGLLFSSTPLATMATG
jgi:hypothetical protein